MEMLVECLSIIEAFDVNLSLSGLSRLIGQLMYPFRVAEKDRMID